MPGKARTDKRALREIEDHKRALSWAIENSSDDPAEYFRWLGTRAQAGQDSAARDMLYGFCMYLDRREPVPNSILEHLGRAFGRYLSRGSRVPLEKALGLVRPPFRRVGSLAKKGVIDRDPFQILGFVYLLIKRDKKAKQEALEIAAERFRISKRQIERYDRRFDGVRSLTGAELEILGQPHAPPPSDI